MDSEFDHGIWYWVFQVTSTDNDKVHSGSLKWSRPYRKVN